MSCDPDICFVDRNPTRDKFLVIACDGVWDVMTNDVVANFVQESLRHFTSLSVVASQLVDQALQVPARCARLLACGHLLGAVVRMAM